MKRIIAIALSIIMLLACTACQSASKSGAQATETQKTAVKDGTYTETVYGNNFDVPFKVAVTFKDNQIANIEVVDKGGEYSEYDYTIIDSAISTLIPRILSSQSLAVDATTGATASSAAIRYAVTLAIKEAGGDASQWNTKLPASNKVVKLDGYDVIVVGLGASGLAAYCSAAEKGAAVFGLDCAAHVGGTSIVAGGPMAINPTDKSLIPVDKDGKTISGFPYDEQKLVNMWAKDTQAGETNGAKLNCIKLMVQQSGKTADWTIDKLGLKYIHCVPFSYPDLAIYACYDSKEKTPAQMYEKALDNANTMNSKNKYMLELTATKILTDDKGAVCGISAQNYDGTTYEVYAPTVILCTGGFGGNSELCKKYIGYPIQLYGMCQNDGKMLQAALGIGAATYNADITPMTHVSRTATDLHVDGVKPSHQKALTNIALSSDIVAVNASGDRFVDESAKMGLTETNRLAGDCYYVIADQRYIDNLKKSGFSKVDFMLNYRDFSDPSYNMSYSKDYYLSSGEPISDLDLLLSAGIKAGTVFEANSVEDLAKQLGMNDLTATITTYNKSCADGKDKQFGKDASLLKSIDASSGKVYAIKAAGRSFSTVGGLNVNENIEVLNTKGSVIPGLYACGTDSMGVLFSKKSGYLDYGGVAHSWCFVSGKVAGENAANYARNK